MYRPRVAAKSATKIVAHIEPGKPDSKLFANKWQEKGKLCYFAMVKW